MSIQRLKRDRHQHERLGIAMSLAIAIGPSVPAWAGEGALWDVSPGQPGMNDRINVLYVADQSSPTGPALLAGGAFTSAGGSAISGIARWDGTDWQPLGDGSASSDVSSIAVLQGEVLVSSLMPPPALARWDGSEWSAVDDAPNSWLGALGVFDAGDGPQLYVSGGFIFHASDGWTDYIVRWDGTTWYTAGDLASVVHEMLVWDDGAGAMLYGAGSMGLIPGSGGLCVGVGRWDGTMWWPLGDCLNGVGNALAVFDDGSGEALFIGGNFTLAGGQPAQRIARWDGSSWSALAEGVNGEIFALAVFDDGAGPALYVGGAFTEAGGIAAQNLARWDGSEWSAVGDGANNVVHALTAVGPDAGGPALAVAGDFTMIDGQPASRIAFLRPASNDISGDIDGDGDVDVEDLLLLLAAWGTADPDVDIDGNGVVDVQDLLLLLANWT
jgi:hypothetical protein